MSRPEINDNYYQDEDDENQLSGCIGIRNALIITLIVCLVLYVIWYYYGRS